MKTVTKIKLCIIIGLFVSSFHGINAQNGLVIRNSRPSVGEKEFKYTPEVYKKMVNDEKIIKEIGALGGLNADNLSDEHVQWIKENKEIAMYYMDDEGVESPFNAYRSSDNNVYRSKDSDKLDYGGRPLIVSSELSDNHKGEYLDDNNLRTAWVEGVEGDGIGESITYEFDRTSPLVTKVYIRNGYVKSDRIWQTNSRVKELDVLINNKPYATLFLDDTWRMQEFQLPDPVGDFEYYDYFQQQMHDEPHVEVDKYRLYWTLTLRIVSVYPGTKYEDTAISEIYFDGVEKH